MNIIILTRNPDLYSNERLIQAAEERGHSIKNIDTLKCCMEVSSNGASIKIRGGDLIENIDAVIPRIGASITQYGTAVVRQFEMMGVFCVNSSLAIASSRDKFYAMQLLAKHKIPLPITAFGHSNQDTNQLIKMVGGAPLIVKLLKGTQGIGVVLAEDQRMSENIINAFKGANVDILVQEYIKESAGSDIRCFVVGNKVVAAMERKAMLDGEFRANIHRGGVGKKVKLTKEEKKIAVNAAKILGLDVAGVDILRSHKGPLVIEVNSSPGLKGIEEVTGVDVSGKIIEFIESNFMKGKKPSNLN